jgi:hypothetical protein
MADTSTDGQDALRLLARAHRALVEEGRVTTEGLLAAWRALDPMEHPKARADALDLDFIARARTLGGDALLGAARIVVEAALPRTAPRVIAVPGEPHAVRLRLRGDDDATGEAFALALGLSLEAAKLAHGLGAPPELLRARFATPNDARAALEALATGGAAREVLLAAGAAGSSPRVDAAALSALVGADAGAASERPVYILAGAGAHRAHDLLSPYARRLGDELRALSARPAAAAARDDEVYAHLEALLGDEAVHAERREVEAADGFLPAGAGVVVVRCEVLADSEVDRRCRDAALRLKRARALLVLVEARADTLAAALGAIGASCRAAAFVLEATAESAPAWVGEAAAGVVTPVTNALAVDEAPALLTLPAAGFVPARRAHDGPVDVHGFGLVQAMQRAQMNGVISRTCKLALKTVPWGDVHGMTRACMDVLGRLGPSQARGRR